MSIHSSKKKPRHFSRLAAIQATYQVEYSPQDAGVIINDFLAHQLSQVGEDVFPISPDPVFFEELVQGILQHQTDLDGVIQDYLAENWSLHRLPSVMRSLLRAACFEIVHHTLTPTPVIINEYIEIARFFFDEKEVKFVNGILDALAKKVRSI